MIYVVTTGGTIEKAYSEQTGSVSNVNNKIERYLQLLRLPDSEVHIVPLLNKDSLQMTDADRQLVLGTVRRLLSEKLPSFSRMAPIRWSRPAFSEAVAARDIKVPIVLTGAMAPLGFEASDGLQNLTESLFAVRLLSPGIYVVIHNQVFPVDRVRKDHALADSYRPTGNQCSLLNR